MRYFLYSMFDAKGLPLYVGQSAQPGVRVTQHSEKYWFDEVANIKVERFKTGAELDAAERERIAYLDPKYNREHKPLKVPVTAVAEAPPPALITAREPHRYVGDRMLRPAEAALLLGYKNRQSVYNLAAAGDLPAPTKIGARASGWRKSTIDAYLASREHAKTPQP